MKDGPLYSRCSLGGKRWFWVVHRSGEAMADGKPPVATGYAPTAQAAEADALAVEPTASPYSYSAPSRASWR
jgi:hypothetical protein